MAEIKKKVVLLPYDYDTAIGNNNEGALVFPYGMEDTDHLESGADVFNGQDSVLWNNLRDAFGPEIKAMYQNLRSTGALSYEKVEKMFEEHQEVWGEAIFNEDAWFKYLEPLVEDNDGSYLAMLQGAKTEQRKWWLYNQFRNKDSKYNAGDALSDVIQLRGYAKADVSVVPYADIYATVKYGSYLTQVRAQRNKSYTLTCPLDNVNDTEIYIYSASQLASVGDLSGLKVGFADFSNATRIQNIKVGDSSASYDNGNMKELYLGNNVLLKTLDVRNCSGLGTGDMKSVDVSNCANIEELYFDGTKITGISLPNGGVIKKLHLPETITNLTIRNQKAITDFVLPSYANISTLWLENNSSAIDTEAILKAIPESTRVRIIGLKWEAKDASEITSLFNLLDKMRGLDEYGNNMDKAQISGEIHTDSLTGAQISDFNSRYPYVKVTADHTTCNLYYYNYDGSQLLYTETIKDGGDGGSYTGTPSRASTPANTFTFIGWSKTPNSTSVDSDYAKAVTSDRKVYAAYKITGQVYTVSFYNGNTLLYTARNVPYGSNATYVGDTPVSSEGSADDYPFEGWNPAPTNIQGNTSCYATFGTPYEYKEITDSWDQIIAACKDGSYKTKYKVGNYKPLDLGSEGTVNMQIAARDSDPLADGTGTSHLTFISEQLLNSYHRMNPYVENVYGYHEGKAWSTYINNANSTSSNPNVSMNNDLKASEVATWQCVFTAKQDFDIQVPSQSISGSSINKDYEYSVAVNDTEIYKNSGGTVSTPAGTKKHIANGEEVTIVLTFKQDSGATTSSYMYCSGYLKFTDSSDAMVSFNTVSGNASTISVSDNQVRYIASYKDATGGIGGWEKSEMRSYLKNTIKPLIPENVRDALKTVIKYSGIIMTSGSSQKDVATNDDVWIPSYYEIFGYASYETKSKYYKDVFKDSASRIKKRNGSADWWWVRSAHNTSGFRGVSSSGNNSYSNADGSGGVTLGFDL